MNNIVIGKLHIKVNLCTSGDISCYHKFYPVKDPYKHHLYNLENISLSPSLRSV